MRAGRASWVGRRAVSGAWLAIAVIALACRAQAPTVVATATAAPSTGVLERLPGGGLPSDIATVSVLSISPVVAGRNATASIRYGTFQTCHAQIQFANGTGLPLGTYQDIAGGQPTWTWPHPVGAPTSGTFVLSCGLDTFAVPFTGQGLVQQVRPLSVTAYPWPTPLSCTTSTAGCQ